jgi:hypothetical protein
MNTSSNTNQLTPTHRVSVRALFGIDSDMQVDAMTERGAHVPDIDDFVAGFAEALAPAGSVSFEFPHLLELVRMNQFDTVYHEHFSYLSLCAVERILATHGLAVWDVETLPTHGGSLRVWAAPTAARREAFADELQGGGLRCGITLGDGQTLGGSMKFEPLPSDFRGQRYAYRIEVGTGSAQVGSARAIGAPHAAEQIQFPTRVKAGLVNRAFASRSTQRWRVHQRCLLRGTPGTGAHGRQVIESLLMAQPLRFAQTRERQAEVAVLSPSGADEFRQDRIAKRRPERW